MEGIFDIIFQYPETAYELISMSYFGLGLFIGCSVSILLGFFDTVLAWLRERKAKKSGKFTNEQRLELLESKIDSLADIVISSSPEEK